MNAVVKSITPNSPASKTIAAPGDALRKINGNVISDILDYEYHSYDSSLLIELTSSDGKVKLIELYKSEGSGLGFEFETLLIDKQRHCANKCIFCFIDQLPKGMRETLYYKDDDVRLSLLQGNYVTLTNLSRKDLARIIKQRISPVNISVHTLDPILRSYMLGGKKGGQGIKTFKTLAENGITLNNQIVCCPGINDGLELSKTIRKLIKLGSCINSVSIVPVGLTKYRQGLTELQPFNKELALKTIRIVEHYGKKCIRMRGSRVFYCADELYIMAGLTLPDNEFYENYPQLQNGVGMMRLFITEFENAFLEDTHFKNQQASPPVTSSYSIVTGILAYPYLTNILNSLTSRYDKIRCEVHAIKNHFFGESITVSGLVTGGDIITQLNGQKLGSKLLIARNMLRSGEEVFLDGITVSDVSKTLGVPVRIVEQDGADLLRALLGN
jgi:putative radical SAM enzyme (TIGR03279 family)